MKTIPISKPDISEAEKAAVLEVLESGILAQGSRTKEFEQRFAAMCGVKHAIAVSSGTTALHIGLLANGIGPGDEVLTTPFSFIATVNAILFTGATPIFVDIEQQTFNLDACLVESLITPRTKAILPVHLYGHMCDMDKLLAIANQYGLRIIEDACQSVRATYQGRYAGSYGTAAFSFYATKNLMCGEGGMITTDDDEVAEQCRMIRNHGMKRRYYHEMLGYNYRLTDLQAAIGLVQLERLPEFHKKRTSNASYLNSRIKTMITPSCKEGYEHGWHQYTVRVRKGQDRDQVAHQLREAGIETGIYYPIPIHKQCYLEEMCKGLTMPVSEQMAKEVLSLPVHTQLSEQDLERIVEEVNKL